MFILLNDKKASCQWFWVGREMSQSKAIFGNCIARIVFGASPFSCMKWKMLPKPSPGRVLQLLLSWWKSWRLATYLIRVLLPWLHCNSLCNSRKWKYSKSFLKGEKPLSRKKVTFLMFPMVRIRADVNGQVWSWTPSPTPPLTISAKERVFLGRKWHEIFWGYNVAFFV